MKFERSDILDPILDYLGANDQTLFASIQQKILTQLAATGQHISSAAVNRIFEGFRDELTKRAAEIYHQIHMILVDSYIEHFDGPGNARATQTIERWLSNYRNNARAN